MRWVCENFTKCCCRLFEVYNEWNIPVAKYSSITESTGVRNACISSGTARLLLILMQRPGVPDLMNGLSIGLWCNTLYDSGDDSSLII